jgi:hypothetical protein
MLEAMKRCDDAVLLAQNAVQYDRRYDDILVRFNSRERTGR